MKKTIITIIATLSLLFVASGFAMAQSVSVGIVDFMLALEKTEKDGALKKLKNEVDKRQKKLTNLEKQIMTTEQEIKENAAVLSEDKMREKMGGYQELILEYRKTAMTYEQEIAEQRAKVLGGIQTKMAEIAAEIAKEKKLDLVIEKNEGAVIFNKPALDFTDELIKKYEATKKSKAE